MGFLDKVKNLFTEEYEVDEPTPIKKEMVQVEIPAPVEDVKFDLPKRRAEEYSEEPKLREVVENRTLERETIEPKKIEVKREETRRSVFFDEKDFMDLDKKEVKEVKKQQPVAAEIKEMYGTKKVEEKKKFTPTPIISPVYGILDKNYHKEDITSKRTNRPVYASSKRVTLDEVRNKAFGTLEDELETTLVNSSMLFNDKLDSKEPEPLSEDLFDQLLEYPPFRSRLEATMEIEVTEDAGVNKNMTLEELEHLDRTSSKTKRTKKTKKEETISNSELFDLIDSMYDKGDE